MLKNLKLIKSLLATMTILVLNISTHAEGVKYSGESEPRFSTKWDSSIGWTVLDKEQKIEFTYCPIGMNSSEGEPDEVLKKCDDEMNYLNHFQAVQFSKKIAGNWRLPTYQEFEKYAQNNRYFEAVTQKFNSGFHGQFYWTDTGVSGHPNQRFTINVTESGTYSSWHSKMIELDDDHKLAFFYVRNGKNKLAGINQTSKATVKNKK